MDVREQLVRAGVELLEEKGIGSLTQRLIATRVGVSHGAPRHHFPSYAHLLAAMARSGVDDLDVGVQDSLSIPNPQLALFSVGKCVIDFAIARPAMFELISRHDLLEGAGANLRQTTNGWLVSASTRIREIRSDGDQRHALALWAGVQGLGTMFSRRSVEAIASDGVDPSPVLGVLIEGVLRAP
ncbi:TetR/AcrR family transcriptional regulator [Gordonia sp. LSe1-13]|uniref:TetR/AcrR family transcriptional regulator n=2 Tax=Gordonia TaxID=2053 RepID=A0ABU7MJD4_9ACTN|nr:TetR/AcrR family transcriptional regulator [Gordonia sp. LSe1-13]MEE4025174.1 TetR/AcrR family transcriptional regulator [Gordonia sp. PKS22-38]